MTRDTVRITIRNSTTRRRQRFVLCDGPVPKKGEVVTLNGIEWDVIKVEKTKIIAAFERAQGKLKQVFP